MTVKMITTAANADCILRRGKSYILPNNFAKLLIDGKFAEPSRDPRAARPGKPDPQELEKPVHEDEPDEITEPE